MDHVTNIITQTKKQENPSKSINYIKINCKRNKTLVISVLKYQQKLLHTLIQLEKAKKYEKMIGPENFIYHAKLGGGSFGEVYLVQEKKTKKLYAMKIQKKSTFIKQKII